MATATPVVWDGNKHKPLQTPDVIDPAFLPPSVQTDFVHVQTIASATWIVNHNLGMYVEPTIMDSGGTEMLGQVQHISLNQIIITFNSPQTGRVRCR